jgi:hypothetical protein
LLCNNHSIPTSPVIVPIRVFASPLHQWWNWEALKHRGCFTTKTKSRPSEISNKSNGLSKSRERGNRWMIHAAIWYLLSHNADYSKSDDKRGKVCFSASYGVNLFFWAVQIYIYKAVQKSVRYLWFSRISNWRDFFHQCYGTCSLPCSMHRLNLRVHSSMTE